MQSKKNQFPYSPSIIIFPILFVIVIWISFWADKRFGLHLRDYGIYPKTLKGLRGIIFSPFIHSDIKHLFDNSIPLLVLSMALFYFYNAIAWRVLILGILVSGFLTWCIGRPAFHIGISGLIYVLVSFIFFKGIFAKHYRLIALSLTVAFLYGSIIWYAIPLAQDISWEGHLSGLITGLGFAYIFKKEIAKPNKFEWEQPYFKDDDDPFLKQFDAEGNFIEPQPPETEIDTEPQHYKYNFKATEKSDGDLA